MSGASHDLLFHDSLFHQHLVITDTSVDNANVTANYDMFPAIRPIVSAAPRAGSGCIGNEHSTPRTA